MGGVDSKVLLEVVQLFSGCDEGEGEGEEECDSREANEHDEAFAAS